MSVTQDVEVSWDELCPNGARRFYEGDDPEGFRAEMWEEFGFDTYRRLAAAVFPGRIELGRPGLRVEW